MKLKRIDLRKAKGHECPGIRADGRTHYLAVLKGGTKIAGTFSREWYGLNFDWHWSMNAGLQFDAPRSNGSEWRELYQIIP